MCAFLLFFICLWISYGQKVNVEKITGGIKWTFNDFEDQSREVEFTKGGKDVKVIVGPMRFDWIGKQGQFYLVDEDAIGDQQMVNIVNHHAKSKNIQIGEFFLIKYKDLKSKVVVASKEYEKPDTYALAFQTAIGMDTSAHIGYLYFTSIKVKDNELPWLKETSFPRLTAPFDAEREKLRWIDFEDNIGGNGRFNIFFRAKHNRWYTQSGHYVDKAGESSELMEHIVPINRPQFQKPDKYSVASYPIIQRASAHSTDVPLATGFTLDKAFDEINTIGMSHHLMIFDFWHPRMDKNPYDGSGSDDVYYLEAPLNKLGTMTFAPHSEYAFVIPTANGKTTIRTFQEKNQCNVRCTTIRKDLMQLLGKKFGHASMFPDVDYKKVNEFVLEQDGETKQWYFSNKPKHTDLVVFAGAFRTGSDGKIIYISNDSGHFSSSRDDLETVATQMGLDDSVTIDKIPPHSAHQMFVNLLKELGHDDETASARANELVNRYNYLDEDKFDNADEIDLQKEKVAAAEQKLERLKVRERYRHDKEVRHSRIKRKHEPYFHY